MGSMGINTLDDTVLSQFLGAEGVAELRSKVIDMIVEEVREQLHDNSNYIIDPDDICSDIYTNILEELKREIMAEYKEKLKSAIQQKLNVILNI